MLNWIIICHYNGRYSYFLMHVQLDSNFYFLKVNHKSTSSCDQSKAKWSKAYKILVESKLETFSSQIHSNEHILFSIFRLNVITNNICTILIDMLRVIRLVLFCYVLLWIFKWSIILSYRTTKRYWTPNLKRLSIYQSCKDKFKNM